MNAPVSIDFKRKDQIVITDEKAQCPKTLATLLEKKGLTVDHLTSGEIQVLSVHGQMLRIAHPRNGEPQTVAASIFKKCAPGQTAAS